MAKEKNNQRTEASPVSTKPPLGSKPRSMPDITFYKLDAAAVSFKDFVKSGNFIEVSLWHNGGGFDAYINSSREQVINLTWQEFDALKTLVKELAND